MSLKKSEKERIKTHILELISRKKPDLVNEIARTFSISNTTVYRYLAEMVEHKLIKRNENNEYFIVTSMQSFIYSNVALLEEDIIYQRDIYPVLDGLSVNIQKIWSYAFTEMMNNAIEHSSANKVKVYMQQTALSSAILICDDGIGIFAKIQGYFKDVLGKDITIDDAIMELFAGKLTTDKQNHSGEGIFFSSRVVDKFVIYSGGKFFSHDNLDNNLLEDIDENSDKKFLLKHEGTTVAMRLSNNSHRELKEVFDMFSDVDKGFFKTQIPIKYAFANGYPVSRSQAKRLCTRLAQFEEVELDFNGVDDIGQGFAHELFIVFKRNYPNIKVSVSNTSKNVSDMIKYVEANDKKQS